MIAPRCLVTSCGHFAYTHSGPDEPPRCRMPGCTCTYSMAALVKYTRETYNEDPWPDPTL